MITAVADTHTALWYLFGDSRLSDTAKKYINQAFERQEKIGVSSITLAEVLYLAEKKRVPSDTLSRLIQALRVPGGVFVEVPLDGSVVQHMEKIPRDQVPELPDRIIAGTALYLTVAVISRDRQIRTSSVKTIW
ncbi:MAG: PIN domain protein [Elusimicrobia bacterium RIFCSPLOWO2_01_FULL_59_12]|nr:MAG: PIN domain protein [Elusimicrobia bacterium RIFCSPLOWO2_01_FULL_59_12]